MLTADERRRTQTGKINLDPAATLKAWRDVASVDVTPGRDCRRGSTGWTG